MNNLYTWVSKSYTSLYEPSAHYFSALNMIDTFSTKLGIHTNVQACTYLWNNTTGAIQLLCNYTSTASELAWAQCFNNASFINPSDLLTSPVYSLSQVLSTEIQQTATTVDNATIFAANMDPHFYSLFEPFIFTGTEDDDALREKASTPDVKLYYPEPFIASPSFVHEDLWFIHVLHYQHWLWFMFISLIMFYFITFINVVRWCNMRTKPKRETRGVSRSKCADLITATVPVTWAISIIVSESVDAADYYDGFGSGEIVVGIRAYQWGWEYFYPKGIDLNYNVHPSYAAVTGNSLKYSTASSKTLQSSSMWKHYQGRSLTKTTNTPAHLLLSPSDNSKVLNFMNFNDFGTSTLKDSTAFKKIQYFSKTNPQGLFTNTSDLSLRYRKLSNLYLNDTLPTNSSSYGTLRQHNFSSTLATTNSFNSLLDPSSLNKFFEYNTSTSSDKSTPINYGLSTNARSQALSTSSNTGRLSALGLGSEDYSLRKLVTYPTMPSMIDSETDAKSVGNSMKQLLGTKSGKRTFIKEGSLAELNTSSSTEVFNEAILYRFKDLKSSNQQFLTSDRSSRQLHALAPNKTMTNFNEKDNNLASNINQNLETSLGNTQQNLYDSSSLGWADKDALYRLVSNANIFTTSHTALLHSSNGRSAITYDRYSKGADDVTPMLLRSKEESAPNHFFSSYWLNHWAHSNPVHRYQNLLTASNVVDSAYLPTFTEYAEYDFRNWQSLELLEDAFWESTYSSFAHDDYLNILTNNSTTSFFKKQEELFNQSVRHKAFRGSTLAKPFLRNLDANANLNSLPIFTEDSVPNSLLLGLKNYQPLANEVSVDGFDDSYENVKYISHLYYMTYKNLLSSSASATQPLSYAYIIDNFRPDYEETSWFKDNTSDLNADDLDFTSANDVRVSNPMKLRSTAKNSIVTYNAIQKVFKSRFDEGRSNARLQDFSNSYVTHPFITESKSPYEGMLGKNRESFFNVNSYNQHLITNFNDSYQLWNSLNTFFSDLPFLLSMKSDPSRYLWFDWQSRWSSIEIQPSSVARYSLLGVPYTNKSFEYTTPTGDEINDSENYLIRLARARKNYMTNWAYTPYFYARVSNWYKTSASSSNLVGESTLMSTKLALKHSSNYWNSLTSSDFVSTTATPSYSGVNTAGRSSWRPSSSIQSFYYNSSILVDILSKREYMYRQYLAEKGAVLSLPKYLTAAPNNPLLEEVKSTYPLIDPVTFGFESSRELFYNNTNFFKLMIIKDALIIANSWMPNSSLNLTGLSNYLFFHLFDANTNNNTLARNTDLYKSQFRPMKKGVTNMIRLHATGAIAMPIEIRLHIIASSKDVIHSWAIPSAGIKIDCVPGYSSHRITTFLVSGIFWGQCMEICGRFHHWMPIVVYFMKRDLFFLWCTHFMHYSSIENTFNMTDRQLSDCVRLVSYDKSTWVHEINKML